MTSSEDRIVRLSEVQSLTGLGVSTIYRRIDASLFIEPFGLGGKRIGWTLAEVRALNQARIASKSDAEIRTLVAQLRARRKQPESIAA